MIVEKSAFEVEQEAAVPAVVTAASSARVGRGGGRDRG